MQIESPRPSAVVLTATTGKKTLERTVDAVLGQSYQNVSSYVVVDGEEFFESASMVLSKYRGNPRVSICYLPKNTGGDNYFCHRIYGALPFLVNQDYIFFCNHDDWFDPDHVEKNVMACVQNNCLWSFSLRKIMDEEGNYICNDECESLGISPVWYNPGMHHIDANCYCLRRDLAVQVSTIWHRRRVEQGKMIKCADTEICEYLLRNQIKGCLAQGFSVNFSVGGNQFSPGKEFFLKGNEIKKNQGKNVLVES